MNTIETSHPGRGDLNAAAELSPDRVAVAGRVRCSASPPRRLPRLMTRQ